MTSTTQLASTYGADLAGADAVCAARAQAAGLPGTYVAWLSTSTKDARDRLGTARGWVRTDGKPFTDRVVDLTSGTIYYPLATDEFGLPVRDSLVHTGTVETGQPQANNCGDFTSSAALVAVGTTSQTTLGWTFVGTPSCTQTARLYCFGIDKTQPLVPEKATGRHVFTTVQGFTAGGGLAAADALCNDEAQLAGLSGTYVALLTTSTTSAISRVSLSGAPWVRLDGMPLVTTSLDLAAGKLETPPNVTSSGTYLGVSRVLTGSYTGSITMTNPNGGETCADWTSSTTTANHGAPNAITSFMFTTTNGACSGTSLYCFEQ